MLELVAERPKRSGVIYAGSRDGVDKLSQKLLAAGVPALAYHAGFDKGVRAARLEQFLAAEAAVMVATIAFGMGVDKMMGRLIGPRSVPAQEPRTAGRPDDHRVQRQRRPSRLFLWAHGEACRSTLITETPGR